MKVIRTTNKQNDEYNSMILTALADAECRLFYHKEKDFNPEIEEIDKLVKEAMLKFSKLTKTTLFDCE